MIGGADCIGSVEINYMYRTVATTIVYDNNIFFLCIIWNTYHMDEHNHEVRKQIKLLFSEIYDHRL